MIRLLAAALVIASLALVACGDDDDESAPTPAEDAAAAPDPETAQQAAEPDADKAEKDKQPPKPGTEITVGSSEFGDMLFDAGDQAIYLFDKETTSTAECYGDCASAWPPVLSDGEPVATGGARQSLLGTTERDDGSTQVTYDGQPLYYYAHEGPGQVLCHNVAEFGGLWLVLGPDGQTL